MNHRRIIALCSILVAHYLTHGIVVATNHDITLYKCLIAEGLNFEDHSCGSLIYGNIQNLSIIGCLYAHNVRRNPRINDNTEFLLANNVFYNWSSFVDSDGDYFNCVHLRAARGTIAGNMVIGGRNTHDTGNGLYFVRSHDGRYSGEACFENNLLRHVDGQLEVKENDSLISRLESKPLWPEGFVLKNVPESVDDVLRTAGARAGDRDATDDRIVKSVINRDGGIIDRQSDVEGYPQYEMTTRALAVPDGTEQRREWLDSLSAEIDTDESLDTSPLIPLITSTFNKQQTAEPECAIVRINSPNPFNSHTSIAYKLDRANTVNLGIYSLPGRLIEIPYDGQQTAGEFTVEWNTENLPGGIYLCRLKTGRHSVSRKIMIH